MNTPFGFRDLLRAAAAALLLALLPGAALAQTGRIAGFVADDDGAPLAGSQVSLVGTGLGTLTDADGEFRFDDLQPGDYEIRVLHIGYRQPEPVRVEVRAGETTRVQIRLDALPVQLAGVVVSASRRAERITDAPATITKIDAAELDLAPGNSFANALRQVKGLDFIQVGATVAAVNARGFNSSFNNRMLMMEDGRIAVLPENGLPVGIFTAIPRLDLESIEVLVGPGAALYGADASNGVLSLRTKDPRDHPGTTFELTGGTRSLFGIQGRHAGLNETGRWGYKLTGEFQRVDEFENFLTYTVGGQPVDETGIDWTSQVVRGTGALVYYGENDTRFEVTAGASSSDGVGQTNVGRNQLDGWTYNFVQAKYATPSWFLNAYRAQSGSGKSYAINRYTENKFLNPNASHEELRLMSDWPSDGQLYAAEVQHNFALPALAGTDVVWGGQFRYDWVSSDEQWLTDRQTGERLGLRQFGAYGHTETPLGGGFRLLLAARVDDHEDYDVQFSPKAGLLYSPIPNHTLRLTYNRAFKSPTILQNHFYIPDFVTFVGVFGNRDGFTVRDADGNVLVTLDPLEPEENQTYELGYKGVIGNRLLVDVTGYYAEYTDFMGSLRVINNPYTPTPTYAHDAEGNRVVGPSGDQIVLTYWNLGEATIYGTDVGLRYLFSPRFDVAGTFSWIKLDSLEDDPLDPDATSLNSPPVKWTVTANARDLLPNVFGQLEVRHVTGYQFASGINQGRIPTFTTASLGIGYRFQDLGADLSLRVNNAFTCVGAEDRGSRECDFGAKHSEMINMPRIGPMAFLALRINR